jgi:hypothetical protein
MERIRYRQRPSSLCIVTIDRLEPMVTTHCGCDSLLCGVPRSSLDFSVHVGIRMLANELTLNTRKRAQGF